MPRIIRAVLLDAVGTVLFPQPNADVAYFEAGRRFGSRLPRVEVLSRYRASFRRQEQLDIDAGDGRTDEDRERRRWRAIVEEVFDDVSDRAALFDDLWRHFASPGSWGVYDDVADAWHTLEQRGLILGLASNFDARLQSVCAGLEPLSRCQRFFVSSQLGFRKPHRGFFAAIEECLGLTPQEIMLIGDSLDNDYEAARAAGWHAIHLDRSRPRGAEDGIVNRIHSLQDVPVVAATS